MSELHFSGVFYVLLFLTAFLYASVGHGGASGYLALMALWNVPPEVMRTSALILNLFVSFSAFLMFRSGRHFEGRIFLPLAVASIPLSFLGGMIEVDATLYRRMLGALLLIPIARFLFLPDTEESLKRPANRPLALLIGGGIGFLSGLIGIGGGILLSPILLLLRWTNQKQTAAISAMFIFVNSLAGLAGQAMKGMTMAPEIIGYTFLAFPGGLLGAYLGALRFPQTVLKYILALVLIMASYKLLFSGK